jgi:hypothetical protein
VLSSTVALAGALAACSSLSSRPPTVDANLAPANYKSSVLAFLQQNPFGLVGTVTADLSPPMLKPFGTESRYVACLRASGPNWHKEKMIVYYGAQINQFVDASEEACKDAAYQPFPELIAMLAQLQSKAK